MPFIYDIIKYETKSGNITFRFNRDNSKIIELEINKDYPTYEPCYNYYFDNNNNIVSIPESNGELRYYNNKIVYTKCYQYQYDKYYKKYPIDDNGRVYRYLESVYNTLYVRYV
jgi:hypothetical protein